MAESIYALSTIAFGSFALVVGVRLLLLSRRTGCAPERLLGLGLLLTAGLGYMVMVAASMVALVSPTVGFALGLLGSACHNAGVVAALAFIVAVFHPGAAWAKALVGVLSAVLWVGWGVDVAARGTSTAEVTAFYWAFLAVTAGYPLWMAAESLHYHGRMRRQLALGLVEPLVANRFLLWGLASLSTAAAVWTISVPIVVHARPLAELDPKDPLVETALLVTAGFGVLTIVLYWLTFFPPAWYRQAIARESGASGARW